MHLRKSCSILRCNGREQRKLHQMESSIEWSPRTAGSHSRSSVRRRVLPHKISSSQPVHSNLHRVSYQIFMLLFITVVKLVMKYKRKNFTVGGRHNTRKCIKGSQHSEGGEPLLKFKTVIAGDPLAPQGSPSRLLLVLGGSLSRWHTEEPCH